MYGPRWGKTFLRELFCGVRVTIFWPVTVRPFGHECLLADFSGLGDGLLT